MVTSGMNLHQYQVEFMDNIMGQVDKCMVGKGKNLYHLCPS